MWNDSAALKTHLDAIKRAVRRVFGAGSQTEIGESMRQRVVKLRNAVLRQIAVPSLVVLLSLGSALAQSGSNPEQGKPPTTTPADAAKDASQNQSKAGIFARAQQVINGPAGNGECVWTGRRIVALIYRDDLDTAFRHITLYERFGCPANHVQAAFRCLTNFDVDDKVPGKDLNSRIDACWLNPGEQPETVAARQPATPAGNGSPEPAPAPTASPSPAPSK